MKEDVAEFYCGPCGLPLVKDPQTYLLAGPAAAEVLAREVRKCTKCKEELPFGKPFVVRVPVSWTEEAVS